jgi:hypothetical protein
MKARKKFARKLSNAACTTALAVTALTAGIGKASAVDWSDTWIGYRYGCPVPRASNTKSPFRKLLPYLYPSACWNWTMFLRYCVTGSQ